MPPGISTNDSPQASEGRWVDMDKMRFHQGHPEKVGGWVKQNTTATIGAPRTLMPWRDNSQIPYIMAGTYAKLYVFDPDSGFNTTDITPIRASGTLALDPFAVVISLTTVTVTHVAHGLEVGDYVHFSGASAGGGITINGQYTVVTVPNANSYTITHSIAAAATDTTTGGAAVLFEYEITLGRVTGGYGLGWGIGPYGMGTYGSARSLLTGTDPKIIEPRVWSEDHFGQIGLATYNTGAIYSWDPSAINPLTIRAAVIADAPTDTRAIFVTPERFVVALCDDRVVKWCDQGDHTVWTPAIDNVAGQRTLTAAGSKLVAGRTVGAINLIWSDYNVHIWQYTGGDFIWNSRLAGNNCGLMSPNAVISREGFCYWMGRYGFHSYNGGNVQHMPNQDDVHAYVFDNLDQLSAYLVAGMYCAKFNEIWWFFSDSAGAEPSLYVICDLDAFAWAAGTLERVGGGHFSDGETRPYWADSSGFVYLHESTYNNNGAAIDAYITLAPATLDTGKQIMDVEGMEADFFEQDGAIELTLRTWDRIRNISDTPLDSQVKSVGSMDGLVDFRLAGRYGNFTVRSNTLDGFFRFGTPAIYVKGTGVRR